MHTNSNSFFFLFYIYSHTRVVNRRKKKSCFSLSLSVLLILFIYTCHIYSHNVTVFFFSRTLNSLLWLLRNSMRFFSCFLCDLEKKNVFRATCAFLISDVFFFLLLPSPPARMTEMLNGEEQNFS